ncbi:CHAT domain-containing protein [Streptomyces sp. NPDC007074]|uniref:CHAT domain-containing protein n=1 Tax=unclassified Streptomyces TaxID=2593676 RepID=UPI0033C5E8AD
MFSRVITYRAILALRHAAGDVVPVLLFAAAACIWLAATRDSAVGDAGWEDAPLGWLTDLLPTGSAAVLVAAVALMTLLRLGTRVDLETPLRFVLQKAALTVGTVAVACWAVHDLPGGRLDRYGPLIAAALLALAIRRKRSRGSFAWLRRRTVAGFGPSWHAYLGLHTHIALRNAITAYPRPTIFATNIADLQAQESARTLREKGDAVSEAYCWALGIDYMVSHNRLPDAERLVRAMEAFPDTSRQPAAVAAKAVLLRAVGEPEESLVLLRSAASWARRIPAGLRGLMAEVALEAGAQDAVAHDGTWRRAALVWREEIGAVLLGLVVEARTLATSEPERALALVYRLCRLPDRVAPLTRGYDPDTSLDSYQRSRTAKGLALMLAGEIHEAQGYHGAAAGAYLDALTNFESTVERTRAARCLVLGFLNGITAGYDDPDQEEHALDMIRVGLQILEDDRGALRGEQHRAAWLAAQEQLYSRVFSYVAGTPSAHTAKSAELGAWLLESLHRTLTEALVNAEGAVWSPDQDDQLARLARLEAAVRARTAQEFAVLHERIGLRDPFLSRLVDVRRGEERPPPPAGEAAPEQDSEPTTVPGSTDFQEALTRLGERTALLYHCTRDARGWTLHSALVSNTHGIRLHHARLDEHPADRDRISSVLTAAGALDALATADEEQTTFLYFTPLDDPVWAELSAALIPTEWWQALCPDAGDVREVVVIPDGPLSTLPFAALPVRDGRPLLEHALITLVPALSMLQPHRSHAKSSARIATVVSHIGVELDPAGTAAEAEALAQAASLLTVRRTADRQELTAALAAAPPPDLAVVSAHGSVGTAVDRALWLADGSTLSAAGAAMLPWPPTVVLASCWINAMIVSTGEEPFGFPLACLLGGANTVVGGAAPVQDLVVSPDVCRLINSLPHSAASLHVLREAALERTRGVPLADLDAATTAALIAWSTAPSHPPADQARTSVYWGRDGLASGQNMSQGELALHLPAPMRALLEAAATAPHEPIDTRAFALAAFTVDPARWTPLPGPFHGEARDEPPEQGSGHVLLRPLPAGPHHLVTTALARALRASSRLSDGAAHTTALHTIAAAAADDASAVARWLSACGPRGAQWADHRCLQPLGGEPSPETLLGLRPGDWDHHHTRMAESEPAHDVAPDAYNWTVVLLVGLLIAAVPALLGAPTAPTAPVRPTTAAVTYVPAGTPNTAAGLDQAMARLRNRAEQAGIEKATFTRNAGSITITAPAKYRTRLETLGHGTPAAQFRPVLALRTDTQTPAPQLGSDATPAPTLQEPSLAVPPALQRQFETAVCPSDTTVEQTPPPSQVVLCDIRQPITYLLDSAALADGDVAHAKAHYAADRGWTIIVEFSSRGQKKVTQITGILSSMQAPQNQLAITAHGQVISAPSVTSTLSGTMEISGNTDESTAKELAQAIDGEPDFRVTDVTVS